MMCIKDTCVCMLMALLGRVNKEATYRKLCNRSCLLVLEFLNFRENRINVLVTTKSLLNFYFREALRYIMKGCDGVFFSLLNCLSVAFKLYKSLPLLWDTGAH